MNCAHRPILEQHPMPGQCFGQHTTQCVKPEKTVGILIGEDHADLVHMGGDHHARATAAHPADQVAHRIHPNFIRQIGHLCLDQGADMMFKATRTPGFDQLLNGIFH